MKSPERRFTLSNDRAAALELLRLQEAAQLANDQLASRNSFQRNEKLSHVVHVFFNVAQFAVALLDETFHHLHHAINRSLRETNPNIPDMPEERNPIFYVYPICMLISLILGILWLTTKVLNRKPNIAMFGNGLGAILIMIGGISAMRHAEKHINLNEVSDEELITHPIFIHNFVMCIVSICGMILYCVPAWLLYDIHEWEKKSMQDKKNGNTDIGERSSPRKCRCRHAQGNRSPTQKTRANSSPLPIKKDSTNVQNEPVILYCCCVDFYKYLKSSKYPNNLTHEFQVIQVM